MLRLSIPWLWLALFAVAVMMLRYFFIEPAELAHACESAHEPAWCAIRSAFVLGFTTYGYGYAGLVAAALALATRRALLAWLAAALGFMALILYCYEAGALALLIGSLRLVRLQADRIAPIHHHGQGHRRVHAEP